MSGRKRYEYRIEDAPAYVDEQTPWLASLGAEGWHLAAIDSSYNPRRFYFARLLPAKVQEAES